MKTTAKLGLVAVIIGALVGGYFLLSAAPSEPVPQNIPIGIKEVIQSPRDYQGKSVRVAGELTREPRLAGFPHLLIDEASSLLVISGEPSTDLDRYVGLRIGVEGVVRYDPGEVGGPATTIVVDELEVLQGEPKLFIFVEKSAEDARVGPILGRQLVLDNIGKVIIYDSLQARVLIEEVRSDAEVQSIIDVLVEGGFFEMETKIYPPRRGSVSFTYNLKVILMQDGIVTENAISWSQPSIIPDQLKAVEELINRELLAGFSEIPPPI